MNNLRYLKYIFFSAIVIILTGCGGGGGGEALGTGNTNTNGSTLTDDEKLQLLEAQNEIPRLDRSTDVAGPDVNNNGVRDDIDAYIASQSYDLPAQILATRQLARGMQSAVTVNISNLTEVKAVSIEIMRAINCISLQFSETNYAKPFARVIKEYESVTTSTKPRLLAYIAFSEALDGSAIILPEGDTCE